MGRTNRIRKINNNRLRKVTERKSRLVNNAGPNPLLVDPSRTGPIRKRLMAEMKKRFLRLKIQIFDLIVQEDAFGLNIPKRTLLGNSLPNAPPNPLGLNARWSFNTNPEKVRAFRNWLRQQLQFIVLGKSEEELWKRYVEEGFQKGGARAFDDATQAERALRQAEEKLDFYQGSRDEFLRSAFGQPVAIEKVKLLAGRAFDELENVSQGMSIQMTRHLADGLVQGRSPLEIARSMSADLDIGRSRAETIARTEIIRAHAEGQLEALELLGVEEVGVAVEWSTAGDMKVCPLCQPLEEMVVKLGEAHGMLPRHPRCRCAWIPANVGESDTNQKDTQKAVKRAIRTSVDRGGDKWGPSRPISKNRPQPLLNTGVNPITSHSPVRTNSSNISLQWGSISLRDSSKALERFSVALLNSKHWIGCVAEGCGGHDEE